MKLDQFKKIFNEVYFCCL